MKYSGICLVFFVSLMMVTQSSGTKKKKNLKKVELSKQQSCWTNPASIPSGLVFLAGFTQGCNPQLVCRGLQEIAEVSNSELCQRGEFPSPIGMSVFVSCLNLLFSPFLFPENTFLDKRIQKGSAVRWAAAKQYVQSCGLYGAGFALGHVAGTVG